MARPDNHRHFRGWRDCLGPDEYKEACNDCEGRFHKSCRASCVDAGMVKNLHMLEQDGVCGEPDCHVRYRTEVETQDGTGEEFSQAREVGSRPLRDTADHMPRASQFTSGASVIGVESQGDAEHVICPERMEDYEEDAGSGNTLPGLPLGDANGNECDGGGGPAGHKSLSHRGSSLPGKGHKGGEISPFSLQ